MRKPIVKFKKFNRFETYANGDIAVLEGVTNHHKLGHQYIVYTSLVVSFNEDYSYIETKNTRYVRED